MKPEMFITWLIDGEVIITCNVSYYNLFYYPEVIASCVTMQVT